jgi:signal transduction histidine kinase
VAVLTKQAKAIQTRHKIDVSTSFIGEPMLPLEVKEALYRVAQEALNNAIKHAHATELDITMVMDENWLILEVRDNGRGFNPEVEYPGHFGLISMRERLEHYSGRLEITSAQGQNTLIRASLPV